MYKDATCYAIVRNDKDKHTELISFKPELLEKIIERMERSGALTINPDNNVFRFNTYKNKGGSLRVFVYAYYKGIPIDEVYSRSIRLYDESLREHNILDLRSENIFDSGDFRPEKARVHSDPVNPDRKCLEVVVSNEQGTITHVCEYSEVLHKILTTSRLVTLFREGDRIHGTLGSAVGDSSHHLSRIVGMYYKFIGRYKNASTAAEEFMRDFPELSKEYEGIDIAHVYPDVWNLSSRNLMLMPSSINKKMLDFMHRFVGAYDAFATKTDAGEVIIEMTAYGEPIYYVCRTAEQYLDFQRVMLGKAEFTKKLKNFAIVEGVPMIINTPAEAYKAVKKEKEDPTDYVKEYWDSEHRSDNLLAHYEEHPEDFRTWGTMGDRPNLCDFIPKFMEVTGNANSPIHVTIERVK